MGKCDICNKDVSFGLSVSHSNRKTNRTWKPNVRKIKIVQNGTVKTASVCTRCLRSNKVVRSVKATPTATSTATPSV
ncbi:MAG: 50S ribosomal protein L28 [Clostridia bacterium]|jgi:large subunit ribosomal protein L28